MLPRSSQIGRRAPPEGAGVVRASTGLIRSTPPPGNPPAPSTLEELAVLAGAAHLYPFKEGDEASDQVGGDDLTLEGGAAFIASPIPGCQGALDLAPSTSRRATWTQSGDWGRDAGQARTWEIVFRFNGGAPGVSKCLMMLGVAYNTANMAFQITSEYGGHGSSTKLRVQDPAWVDLYDGDADLLLAGIDYDDAGLDGQVIYLAITWDGAGVMRVHRRKTGDVAEISSGDVSVSARAASSGAAFLGGNQSNILTMAFLEIHHLAVYPSILSESARAERHTMLGL